MKVFKLYDHLYGYPYLICFGGTEEKAFYKLLKHIGVKKFPFSNPIKTIASFISYRNEGVAGGLLWFQSTKEILKRPGIISHECLHATNHLFQSRGIGPAKDEEDEPYCYYLEWLVNKVYAFASGG